MLTEGTHTHAGTHTPPLAHSFINLFTHSLTNTHLLTPHTPLLIETDADTQTKPNSQRGSDEERAGGASSLPVVAEGRWSMSSAVATSIYQAVESRATSGAARASAARPAGPGLLSSHLVFLVSACPCAPALRSRSAEHSNVS